MVFSSFEFLFYYLPVTILVYYLLPARFRNPVLFFFSILFYGWGEPVYVLLMLATLAADWFFGWLCGKYRESDPKKARLWLILSCVFNLGILGFFKYWNFLAGNLSALFGRELLPELNIELPIGISFYTFQAMSYVIDVYRGDVGYQKNPVTFGTYVALFPQLIAGPVVRYKDVEEQLRLRTHSFNKFASGIRRFVCGLAKKVILADMAGNAWRSIAAVPDAERGAALAWLGILFYTFQIYFDFSAYSDMAIGLGRMIGFEFCENFNYPYIADSITDFWRRWHISLSTWFRDYLYIPLGGNRVGSLRCYRNVLITFVVSGIWHGANWTFVIWGAIHGLFQCVERWLGLNRRQWSGSRKALHIAFTFCVVAFAWIFFRAKTVLVVSHCSIRIFTKIHNAVLIFISFIWNKTPLAINFLKITNLVETSAT